MKEYPAIFIFRPLFHPGAENENRKNIQRFIPKRKVKVIVDFYNPEHLEGKNGFERTYGVIKDIGSSGMCILLNMPLYPQLPVCVQMTRLSHERNSVLRGYHAEVRWCQDLSISMDHFYHVGLEFFESVSISDFF